MQCVEPAWVGMWEGPFPEDGAKDDEIRAFGCGAPNFGSRVTGNANRDSILHSAGPSRNISRAGSNPDVSHVHRRKVAGTQVDAVGSAGEGDVSARVYEKSSFQFLVLGSQLANNIHGATGQNFKFPRSKVFFTQLNVVNAATGSMADGFEQVLTTRRLVAREKCAIGNVVKKQVQSLVVSRQPG
jgi:hypothetical protein